MGARAPARVSHKGRRGDDLFARRIALELRLVAGPTTLLLLLGLLLIAATRLGPLGGVAVWARHFQENLEAFLPLGASLSATGLLLLEPEHDMVEMSAALAVTRMAALRVSLQQALFWLGAAAGTGLLRVCFGPVAYAQGMAAALGPGLLLSGLGLWSATRTGRVAVGYLVTIGLAVLDLVLEVLGAFAAVPPLAVLNLFAFRWNVPAFPWPWVKALQALAGVALISWTVLRVRTWWARGL